MSIEKLTEEQEKLLDDIEDRFLEEECKTRGIWNYPSEFDEDDCPDCKCEDFESECAAIWQAFYLGQQDKGVELAKALVQAVTGRYL